MTPSISSVSTGTECFVMEIKGDLEVGFLWLTFPGWFDTECCPPMTKSQSMVLTATKAESMYMALAFLDSEEEGLDERTGRDETAEVNMPSDQSRPCDVRLERMTARSLQRDHPANPTHV
jgi:hypothetical protein